MRTYTGLVEPVLVTQMLRVPDWMLYWAEVPVADWVCPLPEEGLNGSVILAYAIPFLDDRLEPECEEAVCRESRRNAASDRTVQVHRQSGDCLSGVDKNLLVCHAA